MSQIIGRKGKDVQTEYVWCPYISIVDIVPTPGFPGSKMASKYQNPKIKKIKKILERIEDFNITSS
jgi:hypothetical protein